MIYYSKETDPFINLAIENKLLMEVGESENILFFYKNTPSIILGRFQNPWVECDLIEMQNQKIPLVRRQSGGGTVYHDLGNMNYSFIQGSRDHQNKRNLEILVKALLSLGIDAFYTERSDLRIMHDGLSKKISGAAFKQKKDRSIHHGTMLISSNLETLNGLLKTPFDVSFALGIKSISSTVINLSDINPSVTDDLFIEKCVEQFNLCTNQDFDVSEVDRSIMDHVHYKSITDWTWRFGETPKFDFEISSDNLEYTFKLNKGKVIECECRSNISPILAQHISEILIGESVHKLTLDKLKDQFSIYADEIDFLLTPLRDSGLFCAD